MERVLEDLIRIRKSDFHCSVLLRRKFTWRCCNVQPKVIMETHSFLDVGSTNRTVLQRIQDIGDLFSTAVEGDWMRCQVDHTMPLHHAALFNWDTKSLCFLSVRKGRQKESHRVTRRQNDSMQKKKNDLDIMFMWNVMYSVTQQPILNRVVDGWQTAPAGMLKITPITPSGSPLSHTHTLFKNSSSPRDWSQGVWHSKVHWKVRFCCFWVQRKDKDLSAQALQKDFVFCKR